MPLINWKLELKLKRTNHSVLFAKANDNTDAHPNKIIFLKDTKLYLLVVTLSAKDNPKIFLEKDSKDLCIIMNI